MTLNYFVQISALSIGDYKSYGSLRRFGVVARIVSIFGVCALFSAYHFYTAIIKSLGVSTQALNLEQIFIIGWHTQSLLSMMFIIHWQTSGSIKLIKENILISSIEKQITWLKLKKTCRLILTIVVCNVTVLMINLVYNWTTFFRTRPIRVIIEFGFFRDVFHSIYSLYGPYAWHISLCIFIVTVKSLELELREFNTNFKKILDSHALTLFTDVFNEAQITQNKLTRALLNKYVEHRKLAEKVTKVDEIFKFYVLIMLITGGAHTIFTVLSTIRQKGWIHMVFFAYDIFLCVWHLLGLCIIPAQVYREFRAVNDQLYRHTDIWMAYNLEVYEICQMFSENVSRSSIGISLCGFILITNRVIFTCFSLLTTYVILCLQLQLGSDYKSWRYSNLTHIVE